MEKKKQLTNEENISNLKKRARLRIAIMIFGPLAIIAALLNLFIEFPIVVALIFFIITAALSKERERTIINKNKELLKIERVIEKQKQQKKGKVIKKIKKES